MNLKTTLMAGALAAGLALSAAPANAYIFGFSDQGNDGTIVTLTLDGMTSVSSYDTGWYNGSDHNTDNTNYIVAAAGEFGNSTGYNNWFAFDLTNIMGSFTTASITFNSYVTDSPANYHVYDFGGDISSLTGGTGGLGAFNDLASGTSYGVFGYSSANNNLVRTLTLNAAAVADINQALGGRFALGGTLEPSTVVPEPATWAMMLLGFFGLGSALRAGRRVTTVA